MIEIVAKLYRDEPLFPALLVANLCFAIALVWLYAHLELRTMHWVWAGLQFGVAIWLLWALSTFLIDYAGKPIPEKFTPN